MTKTTNKTRSIVPSFVLSFGAGLVALILALVLGGAATASALGDAGDVVRFGQPIAKFVLNLSMATAVGTLALAAFALADKSVALKRALDIAAFSSAAWAVSGAVYFLFTYLRITGVGIAYDESFGKSLWVFATQIELGTSLAINVLIAVALSLLSLTFRSLTATLFLAVAGIAALVPLAQIGHASSSANHSLAVNAMGMHLVAVTIWVGGFIALLLLRKSADEKTLVKRYSTLALTGFVLMAISGIASAYVRIPNFESLFGAYGTILLFKSIALVALGSIGAIYRLRMRLENIWKLVAVEAILFAVAIGLATALGKTAPPTDGNATTEVTPAQLLTGEPLPPELTPIRFLTAWKIDLAWLVICIAAIVAYLIGVRRLSKRGDHWPVSRTASWIIGMLTLIYVTSGALNAYQEYLFSVHMVGHMILAMGIPVLLVPGAPVTLLMRAVEKRHDDSRGVREWVLWAVHTKYAKFVANPIVAAILFASSLVTFYYTPLFAWATNEHLGHEWMIVHFLITGYLFAQALIGIDPGPYRLPYPARLLLLIAAMAFHAFFGLSLMDGSGLLLADWYGAMGRTWGDDPLTDQQIGGAIAWGIGELPTAALTIIVAVQWYRSDARDAKRLDRQSDRTGNKDIEEYNAMLAKLAERDTKARR